MWLHTSCLLWPCCLTPGPWPGPVAGISASRELVRLAGLTPGPLNQICACSSVRSTGFLWCSCLSEFMVKLTERKLFSSLQSLFSRIKSCIFKDLIYFLERTEGRERERVKKTLMCETNVGCLSRTPLGTRPTTQACALTGSRTGDPLVLRPALSPLSHTCQDKILYF